MRAREEIHGKGRPGRDRPFGRSILYHEGSDPPERNIQDQHTNGDNSWLRFRNSRHVIRPKSRPASAPLLKTFEANHATYVNARKALEAAEKERRRQKALARKRARAEAAKLRAAKAKAAEKAAKAEEKTREKAKAKAAEASKEKTQA